MALDPSDNSSLDGTAGVEGVRSIDASTKTYKGADRQANMRYKGLTANIRRRLPIDL